MLEELEKIYTASNNIKIVIQNTFKMIEAQTEPIVQEKFSSLLKYVEENPNCQCFYCKAKQSIDFLKPPKDINTENCGIAIQQFAPREVFYSFEDENVENEIGLKEYCATFLFVLFLEQHKFFPSQIHTLISGDNLKYSDILASISPFYNASTQLLHMGGRIGMGASGRRDKEFLQNHSTHYKLVLPHKSQLTQLVALNAHQRHQCSSPAFVRLVLNEQFYVPRATVTIKSAPLEEYPLDCEFGRLIAPVFAHFKGGVAS